MSKFASFFRNLFSDDYSEDVEIRDMEDYGQEEPRHEGLGAPMRAPAQQAPRPYQGGPRRRPAPVKRQSSKVIDFEEKGERRRPASHEIILAEPRVRQEIQQILDLIRQGKTVITNLEYAERDMAQRLLDMLSGGSYALGGKMEQLPGAISYLVTPGSVYVNAFVPHQEFVQAPAQQPYPAQPMPRAPMRRAVNQ